MKKIFFTAALLMAAASTATAEKIVPYDLQKCVRSAGDISPSNMAKIKNTADRRKLNGWPFEKMRNDVVAHFTEQCRNIVAARPAESCPVGETLFIDDYAEEALSIFENSSKAEIRAGRDLLSDEATLLFHEMMKICGVK